MYKYLIAEFSNKKTKMQKQYLAFKSINERLLNTILVQLHTYTHVII